MVYETTMTPPPPKAYFPVAEPIPTGTTTSKTYIPPLYPYISILPSGSIHLSIDISTTVETPPTPYPHIKISVATLTQLTTVDHQSPPLFTTHIHISRNLKNTVGNLNTPKSPSTTTLLTPVHTVNMISPRNIATPDLKLSIKTTPPDSIVENQSTSNHKRHIKIFHTPVPIVETDIPYAMETPGPPVDTPSHTTPLNPEFPIENTLYILLPTASPFTPMQIFKPCGSRRSHKKKRLSRIGKATITTPKQICPADKLPRKLKLLSPSSSSQPTPVR